MREGYSKDPTYYSRHTEGFAKELEFYSELVEGKVYIDGYYTKNLYMGDKFVVDTRPEYRLKCIRFLL